MNTPIKREDIRKGDVIVQRYEFTALVDFKDADPDQKSTYELIERPVVLPTEPGWYLDRQGDIWRLLNGGLWCCYDSPADGDPAIYAPLTLLRPVAEVAAEVLAQVHALFGKGAFVHSDINALAAKWATK